MVDWNEYLWIVESGLAGCSLRRCWIHVWFDRHIVIYISDNKISYIAYVLQSLIVFFLYCSLVWVLLKCFRLKIQMHLLQFSFWVWSLLGYFYGFFSFFMLLKALYIDICLVVWEACRICQDSDTILCCTDCASWTWWSRWPLHSTFVFSGGGEFRRSAQSFSRALSIACLGILCICNNRRDLSQVRGNRTYLYSLVGVWGIVRMGRPVRVQAGVMSCSLNKHGCQGIFLLS